MTGEPGTGKSATLRILADHLAGQRDVKVSNLHLRRNGDDRITLSVEHRAAPPIPVLTLELVQRADALALEVVDRIALAPQPVAHQSVDDRIAAALCRVRTATLYERLAAMTSTGRVIKYDHGYHLAG